LLDRRGLGVALRDDDPAEVRAMLARHLLPRGLARLLAEVNAPRLVARREEDPPAVIGHLHVVEIRPARGLDTDRGAQVHVERRRRFRAHLVPPREIIGLPLLERAL